MVFRSASPIPCSWLGAQFRGSLVRIGFRVRSTLRWPLTTPVRSGHADFGSLRRVRPISAVFGLDRGTPIDRYYIERFLKAHCEDMRGRVLEIGDATYTRLLGGSAVTQSDVLRRTGKADRGIIVADLSDAPEIPDATYDCVILTQTLQFIFDAEAAIRTLHRIISPGGVLLLTVPGISQLSRYDVNRWGEYWRFTSMACRRLLEDQFGNDTVSVEPAGNVLATVAFLHGIAVEELSPGELDFKDRDYELVVMARAMKRDPEVGSNAR
jgi:SAM-dependent methyltransferase